MTPGPTIIHKCSACGKHFTQHTIGSGNTFGARFWSDGFVLAPMLPDQPWLIKCPHCGAALWVDEQEEVERIDWLCGENSEERMDRLDASPVSVATLDDYINLLAAGLSDKEKERYVRLRVWWLGNNARRGPEPEQASPMTEVETANLKALASLLDENDDNDRIMKAESLRELGMFADVEKLLAKPFDDHLMAAVTAIRSLAQKQNTTVAEITDENDEKRANAGAIYV